MTQTSYFSKILGPAQKMVADLLSDENLREELTYKKYLSESFSSTLKYNVITYQDTVLYGVRLAHTYKSALIVGGQAPLEIGDLVFIFEYDGFPTGYSLKDRIEDADGNVLTLKDIKPVFNIAFLVTIGRS